MNGRLERESNFYRPELITPQMLDTWRANEHAADIRATWNGNVNRYFRRVTLNGIATGVVLAVIVEIGANLIRAGLHFQQWAWMAR